MPDTAVPPFDLAAFLPYRLAVAAAQVSRAFAARYRDDFGISIPEWRVLAHLAQGQVVSVRDIHVRVDMDKSKVSRAASRLEAAGLITKVAQSGDRRLLALSLTPQGVALMSRLIPVAQAFQAELQAKLGDAAPMFEAALVTLMAPPP
jgi:DNA-binding MarR family transcriptional regulator